MKMFIWKKKLFLVEKYFVELEWIFNVKIYYDGCCVCVNGDLENCNFCLCVIESLYLGWKGGDV